MSFKFRAKQSFQLRYKFILLSLPIAVDKALPSILKLHWIAHEVKAIRVYPITHFNVIPTLTYPFFVEYLILNKEYVLMVLIQVLLLVNTVSLDGAHHRCLMHYYALYRLVFFQD
jgi:hypothetical protein